jgi:hypothetical protein
MAKAHHRRLLDMECPQKRGEIFGVPVDTWSERRSPPSAHLVAHGGKAWRKERHLRVPDSVILASVVNEDNGGPSARFLIVEERAIDLGKAALRFRHAPRRRAAKLAGHCAPLANAR